MIFRYVCQLLGGGSDPCGHTLPPNHGYTPLVITINRRHTSQTDRRTDRQTDNFPWHNPRYATLRAVKTNKVCVMISSSTNVVFKLPGDGEIHIVSFFTTEHLILFFLCAVRGDGK